MFLYMSENRTTNRTPDSRSEAQREISDFMFSKGQWVFGGILIALAAWFIIGLVWN